MATQDLTASISGSASASINLNADVSFSAILPSESYVAGALDFKKTGLKSTLAGSAQARASLSSKFTLGTATADGSASAIALLGAERSRTFSAAGCEFFMAEADGSSHGTSLLDWNSRWQRKVSLDEDSAEWIEGRTMDMSNSATTIINPGAPITSGSSTSNLWIDRCAYDASVVWPVSGNKNQIITAEFSASKRGFKLTSAVKNPPPFIGIWGYETPTRNYTAQFAGTNRFDVRLADTSNTRGLRLGYAYRLESEGVNLTQSGSWTQDFSFTIPTTLSWRLYIDYYIKTACDLDDVSQERNVANIHHEVDLETVITDPAVDGLELRIGVYKYMEMNQSWMDEAMERHATVLMNQLDNYIHPEEEWQMYPIRLDKITFQIRKENSRIDFQLSNQYPALIYQDDFANRILDVFLDSESPVVITESSSASAL